MADQFLGGQAPAGAFECYRPAGDLVRYDPATNAIGVLSTAGIIHTFFKPKSCPPGTVIPKGCHTFSSHLAYAQDQCNKVFTP